MEGVPNQVAHDARYARLNAAHERYAIEARLARKLFLRLTRMFIISSAVAAIVGGLLLFGTEVTKGDGSRKLAEWLSSADVRTVLAVIQSIGLAVAAATTYVLGKWQPQQRWLTYRLKAEEARLAISKRIVIIGHEHGEEVFIQSGDWFVEFLKQQIRYLDQSAQRHTTVAFRGVILGALLAGFAALGSALAGTSSDTLLVALAFTGIGVPVLSAAVERWANASADTERAHLHAETWASLNALSDEIPNFLNAIQKKDLPAAMEYVDQVCSVLEVDHLGFGRVVAKPVKKSLVGD